MIVSLIAVPGYARIGSEFASSINSTDNIYSDSSGIYDAYSLMTLNLKMYPFPSLEATVNGKQTNYRDRAGLSSQLGGLTLAYVPTPKDSRLAIYITGSLNGQLYHNEFKRFDNNYISMATSIGYDLSSRIMARAGVSYRNTTYVRNGLDKRDVDYSVGLNTTLPGNNSFDLEAGFAYTNCPFKDTSGTAPEYQEWMSTRWEDIPDKKINIRILCLSPRISRPLGNKSGIYLSYTRQLFQNYDKQWTSGDSAQFLSPWASVWDGSAVTAGLKSFLIPHFILTANAGYWDKTYFKANAAHSVTLGNLIRVRRKDYRRRDYQTTFFVDLRMPLKSHSGLLFEPSVNVNYSNTRSNDKLFGYSNLIIAGGIKIRY